MRSILVLISAAIIAVMGFGIYWMMTGAESPQGERRVGGAAKPASATLPAVSDSLVGPGQGAGWDKYDPKTGLLTSRIRVDRYVQAKDGRMQVTRPCVDFFMKNGQVLRIYGERGTIVMQETVSRNKAGVNAPNLGQPRAGELADVTLFVLPDADTPDEKATLTMRMNNASFDNETFKIQTEAYRDPAGNLVPGDRVPIVVRGTDYEFDGTGLRVQYNEVDRRLEYLRVAYGQRLLVKNTRVLRKPASGEPKRPGAMLPGAAGQAMLAATEGGGDGSLVHAGPTEGVVQSGLPRADGFALAQPIAGIVLAAAKPVPVGPVTRRAAPGARPVTRPAREIETPVYRATFKENVAVFQAGRKLATGEELIVDFLQQDQDEGAAVGVDPSKAATRPAGTTRPAAMPEGPRRGQKNSQANSAGSTSRPTSRPAEEPIEIRWTGPLVVIPLAGDKPARLAPGEAIVRISGSPKRPVEVTRINGDVLTTLRCARLTHWTIPSDQGAQLEESADLPVEMTDSRGMKLLTHTMVYSQKAGNAILYGKSSARLPIAPPDAGGELKTELMDAAWTERCVMNMKGGDLDAMQIDRVSLQGDVAIRHPQISLDSNMLDLQFVTEPAAPTTRPTSRPTTTTALKQLDANGNVKCIAIGQGGEKDIRKIDCDSLKVLTAPGKEGKLYARELVATGNVYTFDPEREMWAGNLDVVLAQPTTRPATTRPATQPATQPATRPSQKDSLAPGELESLWAHLNVRVRTADGKEAYGDHLNIEVKDKQTQVTLSGRPAVVKREKDSLSGPVITMAVESQHLSVMGEGKLTGVQPAGPDKPARPVQVTFTRMLDGWGDVMDLEGNVVTRSLDPDGTVNTATGQRVRLTTTTRPTTQPAATKKTTTRPSGELDVMANRVIESVTLTGGAMCESVLNDKLGALLRRFHVDSEVIQFMQKDEKAKELVIPGPGRMSFEDLRPPANDAAAKARAADPMGMRGRTAFSWKERLTYSEKVSQLVMVGDVIVARELLQGEKHEPMRMQGDRLVADIVPQDALPTSRPATRPATRPGEAQAMNIGGIETQVQIKKVHMEGNVVVRSDQLYLLASTIDYDPATYRLTVRGNGRQRARELDPKTELEKASFDELILNTQTNQVIDAVNLRATGRK